MTELAEVQTTNKCPVCPKELSADTTTVCSVCGTPHHTECWEYAYGCSVYGCTAENRTIIECIEELYSTLKTLLDGVHADVVSEASAMILLMKSRKFAPVVVKQHLESELAHWKKYYRERLSTVDPVQIEKNLESIETFAQTWNPEDCTGEGLVAFHTALDNDLFLPQNVCEQLVKDYDDNRASFVGPMLMDLFLIPLAVGLYQMGGAILFSIFPVVLFFALGFFSIGIVSFISMRRLIKETVEARSTRLKAKVINTLHEKNQEKLNIINYDKELLPPPIEQKQITGTEKSLLTEKGGQPCKQLM